jgi:HlyD family secretion protein
MKRIWQMGGIIVVVAALSVGGYLKFAAQPASAASAANLNTATVQRGTLAATVNAAGNITAAQQVALNFQQTGVVQKVNVQVGDQVKAGQALAALDTTDLQLQVQNAQVNLKVAQDKLAQAKNPNTAQDIASARAQVDSAQAAYNKLVAGAAASDIAAAQTAVTSAQAAYTAAVNAANAGDSNLATAAAAVQKAQAAVQAAQAAYDKIAGEPNIGSSQQALTLQSATTDYQSALAGYQSLQATSKSDAASKVQSAKAALGQAQANLVKLQTQVNQNDVVAAKAQVTQAQNNLDKLLAGSDANTLDIAQNGVDQANIALQQAQAALAQAQVVAPFDGIVTAVNVTPGQEAANSTAGAIQLADLNHLQVVVNMAEVDVNKTKVGQDVQVTLDAVPNRTFQGKVSLIAPAGVMTQGVVNYPVTIDLTNPSNAVKTGMTANLNVIIAQHDNVLMVPNRAVKTAASGTNGANRQANGTTTAGSGANGATQNPTGNVGAATAGNNANGGANGSAGARPANGGNGSTSGTARQGGGTGSGNFQRPNRQQYVTVLQNGQQVQVPVQTGLSNDTMTEIVSGLNEGDLVVLNTTATTAPRTGGGPGVGLPGVGRIGG